MPGTRTPIGTTSPGGWTASGAGTLHEAVATNDDGTSYAVCSDGTAAVLTIDPADNPNELTGHVLTVRAEKAVDLLQTVQLRAELMEGATVIGTLDVADVPDAWADFTYTLSEAEAAVIVDYSALTVRLTDIDSPLLSEARVTFVELGLPDRRLRVHCAG